MRKIIAIAAVLLSGCSTAVTLGQPIMLKPIPNSVQPVEARTWLSTVGALIVYDEKGHVAGVAGGAGTSEVGAIASVAGPAMVGTGIGVAGAMVGTHMPQSLSLSLPR